MLTNTNQIKRLLYSFVIAFIFWFFIKSDRLKKKKEKAVKKVGKKQERSMLRRNE
jgi:phosphotransferase system  glucose/maltose/N-acetylglucosamine-specific IIC component